MIGRRIPWNNSRAIAYMMCNETFGAERRKVKRQARREERRWLKGTLCEQDA
jgi:hypothetical protein